MIPMAQSLLNAPIGLTGVSSFLYTFHVLYRLMCFASSHNESSQYNFDSHEETRILTTLRILLLDACLLSLFMLQHTLMAREEMKNIYIKLGIGEIERSIYNATSSASLSFLMNNWQGVPWVSLWNIETSESNVALMVFLGCHIFGWCVIYSGCLMMDFAELAGLKQIYYKFTSRSCPLSVKSKELCRYYAHMRHPSFIGFLIVLWIRPSMTIDRLLLSSLLTIYMIMMWSVDQDDCRYHANAIQRKRRHLS
ncbi:nurim homolog [Venturia canescens]|uniref:nurim homolog n=1 Tax=Venturia canescens TaxID=32260 RepID=UPI001C9C0F52|nr:nurim homolog [Venturia canescens]